MALAFDEFDPARPALFYLPSPAMLRYSDSFILAGTMRLPVHMQIIGMRCKVVEGALLTQLESSAHCGQAMKQGGPPGREAPLVALPAALAALPLLEVALFLRFLYRPEEATPEALHQAEEHLEGVARLADFLEARVVSERLEAHHLQCAADASAADALCMWSDVAARLWLASEVNMDGLRTFELERMVSVLAKPACWPAAMALMKLEEGGALACCRPALQRRLLAALAPRAPGGVGAHLTGAFGSKS